MSEKVKIPREVAEAIERFRSVGADNASIIYTFASGSDKNNSEFADFAADNFDILLRALVNDYEVEESPEDVVKRKYKSYSPSNDYGNCYRQAVRDTLNALGISIGGVNA